MSLISELNQYDLHNKLPLTWFVEELEHESIVKICSNLHTNYVTIQYWDNSYIVIPFVEISGEIRNYDEQRKRCSTIDDALYHAILLIESWSN